MLHLHAAQLRPATAPGAHRAPPRGNVDLPTQHRPWIYQHRDHGRGRLGRRGELLSLPFLIEYGRTRLANVVTLLEQAGGLTEYNSPTYTRVALEEAERALLLVSDPAIRADAERLRVTAWKTIAEHYHPATGQIAGPCSRAYSDWITPGVGRYLARQTGVEIPLRTSGDDGLDLVVPIRVPAGHRGKVCGVAGGSAPDGLPVRATRIRRPDRHHLVPSRTCLGSVNRDPCWNQRRPLLAYWRTDRDPAVCLRVRVCC